MAEELKYRIRIISRYTGGERILGALYASHEEAEAAAEKEVCPRCNRYQVEIAPDWAMHFKQMDALRRSGGY